VAIPFGHFPSFPLDIWWVGPFPSFALDIWWGTHETRELKEGNQAGASPRV